MSALPVYAELPVITVNGREKHCAWGVFDKNNKKDVFGCLNKITPDIVSRAASEVKDGITISLK